MISSRVSIRKWRSLTRIKEFQKVYGEGVKHVGRLLVVYLLPADDFARGVVASRKVGGAVKRNRAKRLMREALGKGLPGHPGWGEAVLEESFRKVDPADGARGTSATGPESNHCPEISPDHCPDTGGEMPDQGGKAGLWIVVVARRNILSADSREVQEELDALLEPMAREFSAGL